MAHVAREAQTKAWVDEDRDDLLREWSAIPAVARRWDDWDELDRLVFVFEWPLRVDRMMRLESWNEQHALTEAQQARYCNPRDLIDRHQSALDRLLAE